MIELNTDLYNYRFALINQQAELSADIFDFIKVINQVSQEDFPEKGEFSVKDIVQKIIRAIVSCVKWAFEVINKVLKFLVYGYQPGFKRCKKLIEQISPRLPSLQAYSYNHIVTPAAMTTGANVIEKHVNTEIPGLGQHVPSNKISVIRKMYINEFNKLQLTQGQIDMNFAMIKPPATSSGKLKDFGIKGKGDFDKIIEKFEEIQNTLSEKLKELKKTSYKVRQIINKVQDHKFAEKYVKNKIEVTETLIVVFEAAIVGQDTKWLKTMQNTFLKELYWFRKKAGNYVAAGDTDENEPEKDLHETF